MPFVDFLLTFHGYVQNDQPLMLKRKVKTVGIVLADERAGPFQLDLAWIAAANADMLVQRGVLTASPRVATVPLPPRP